VLPAPRPAVRSNTARPLLLALAFALAAWAAPACALEVTVGDPTERDGWLWIHLGLGGLFEKRTEESLSRGMPATLHLSVELWKRRAGWFDRHVERVDASIKVRYDVWRKSYRIERRGAPVTLATTIDSVRTVLSRPLQIAAARLDRLDPRGRYYVVASVALKPLTVEDVAEGEGWLSGEVEEKREAGLGILTAIPRTVFDAARNFAGLGDERARAISDDFDLSGVLFRAQTPGRR
jgi:hypothetical protein